MSAIDRLHRITLQRQAARPEFRTTPSERRAMRRRNLWATAIWGLAFALFAVLVALRIRSYLPG